MSTDVPEGNEPQRGGSARPPRVGDSRSPVGSTLSIVLAVIAVVAGFLIIRELTDDDDPSTATGGNPSDESIPDLSLPTDGSTPAQGTTASGDAITSTTAAAAVRSGATIAVANASGVGGSAAAMGSALTVEGYEGVGEPGNATGEQLSASVVYYVPADAAAQAVAQTLATDLGGVSVQPMPTTRPATAGNTGDATVLLMLGTDAANKSLSELRATTVTAPDVGGGTATTEG
jgi:hypothetical protein